MVAFRSDPIQFNIGSILIETGKLVTTVSFPCFLIKYSLITISGEVEMPNHWKILQPDHPIALHQHQKTISMLWFGKFVSKLQNP